MGCGLFFAFLMIFAGAWIWASNYGITFFSFYRDWPVLIVIIGLWIFLKLRRRRFWKQKNKE